MKRNTICSSQDQCVNTDNPMDVRSARAPWPHKKDTGDREGHQRYRDVSPNLGKGNVRKKSSKQTAKNKKLTATTIKKIQGNKRSTGLQTASSGGGGH
ncbi:hypothetical protein AVEN_2257-1 [Araneus ventricosus]|uniref:Uncharacterized protein n=1 Tax=Araneus ventricosus TaxID=182803 RepID=A0A4Y2T092_ARAVE|nr:hypothetical protein AVEN_168463-1 [Araneus ventricosus]GBN93314.1 hypothetical protein AVEN_2257-1 [Araneus ventricosus]